MIQEEEYKTNKNVINNDQQESDQNKENQIENIEIFEDAKKEDETLKMSKKDSNIKKEKSEIKGKHNCKFSSTAKLVFWSLMLLLALILGIETIVQACDLTVQISDSISGKSDEPTKGIWFLNVTILWIEAIFFLIIISWGIWGTTKNGIIVNKNRKAKKAAKELVEPKQPKKSKNSKKNVKAE